MHFKFNVYERYCSQFVDLQILAEENQITVFFVVVILRQSFLVVMEPVLEFAL